MILHIDKDAILHRTTLNTLEAELPTNFIRVHRSYIINKNYVSEFKYLNNNTFSFKLRNGKEVISSRSYKNSIVDAFES